MTMKSDTVQKLFMRIIQFSGYEIDIDSKKVSAIKSISRGFKIKTSAKY